MPTVTSRKQASCRARRRRFSRYGAVSSSAAPVGRASAWKNSIVCIASTCSSKCPRHLMSGVSAEAMFTAPTSAVNNAANLGSQGLSL